MKKLLIIFILCFSDSLNAQQIQWQNTIGGNDDDGLYNSVSQTTDGGYVIGGSSKSNISGDKTENSQGLDDYWVVKLDQFGAIQWQNTIGGNSVDILNSVSQTFDGGFILGGYSTSGISGDKTENYQGLHGLQDYWVVKLDSSGLIQWQNTIGGHHEDYLFSVSQTFDKGFILGGYSSSGATGDKTEASIGAWDIWVVKLDSLGTIQWQNTIGGSGTDLLYSISQTSDGGYIFGGPSTSDISGDKSENSNGGFDFWVVKLDSTGVIQWQNTIGGSEVDYLRSVVPTADSGFILGGESRSDISGDKLENSQGSQDFWVVKLDSTGVIQWQNTIGGSGGDYLWSVSQASKGGYILGGNSWSNISGDKTEDSFGGIDYWIVKLDSTGIIQWQKTIGGTSWDRCNSIIFTKDEGYLACGTSESDSSGNKTENSQGFRDYWIVKLNSITTSIKDEHPVIDRISIYPNPTEFMLYININTIYQSNVLIELCNIFGQPIREIYDGIVQNGDWQKKIDTSDLVSGTYFIRCSRDINSVQRFIKL